MNAVVSIHPTRTSRLRRLSRAMSLGLLAASVLVLLGEDAPDLFLLRTQPVEGALFLLMLFGLAINWRHPLQGGITTTLASLTLLALTRGASAPIAAVFLLVALMDVRCGWCEWREARVA